jgi:hypothetical protein
MVAVSKVVHEVAPAGGGMKVTLDNEEIRYEKLGVTAESDDEIRAIIHKGKARDPAAGWLTRSDAVNLMGCAYWTILTWQKRGMLHPKRRPSGSNGRMVWVYDPAELARMPRRQQPGPEDPGELCARVYEMLDAGAELREIVILTRKPAYEIDRIFEAWRDHGGGSVVIGRAAKAELEALVGPFANVAELISVLKGGIAASVTANDADGGAP